MLRTHPWTHQRLSGHFPSPMVSKTRSPNSRGDRRVKTVGREGEGVDLVLSSGFMAFAKHAGFLKAVDEANLDVMGVMGTSSGALSGSLYCAGYRPTEVAQELCQTPPIQIVRPNLCFWKGFFLLDEVVNRLKDILPATFEALEKPFAVGVVNANGEHQILNSGPLPEAVAASAAIPILFAPVTIPGNVSSPFYDGGFRDRIGLQIWRQQRRKACLKKNAPPAIVHLIGRSTPLSGSDDIRRCGERRVFVLRTKRSQRNFFSLGDYQHEMTRTCDGLMPSMDRIATRVLKQIYYTS